MSARGITPARPEDRAGVEALLAASNLPVEGIADALDAAVVARDAGGTVEGCAALEFYGSDALLRSVAVAPQLRGGGLGRALVEAALVTAQARGAQTVYLLTTTASDYFPRLGFTPIARVDVPAAVQSSAEFSTLCPASATAMRRALG